MRTSIASLVSSRPATCVTSCAAPCWLYPTVPGLFASLVQGLRDSHAEHPHLHTLQRDFDQAFRDLHDKGGEGRIKTCLQKQINLLEALGRDNPRVKE